MNKNMRWLSMGASVAALAFVAGCSSPELADTPPAVAPPPPPAAAYTPSAPSGRIETTELLGGPAAAPARPAPARQQAAPPPVAVTSMKPIPNPEQLSRADRARIYGHNNGQAAYSGQSASPAQDPYPVQYDSRHPVGRAHRGDRVVSSRPVPNPSMVTAPGPVSRPAAPVIRQVPVSKPSGAVVAKQITPVAKPVAPPVIAAKPLPPKPAPVAAPAPVVKTPVVKAPVAVAPVVKAPVAKPKTKLEQLGMAVATDVTGGSKLTVPPELADGKQGVVSLTLTPSLADRITAEAAKLGFTREARTVDARATLSGKGYTVIPSASQSARLKGGEVTTFNWQVTPVEGEKGLLKADVSGDLKGGAKPQSFTIASIQQVPAAPVVPVKKGFNFGDLFKSKPAAETAPATATAEPETASAEAPVTATNGKFIDKLALPGRPSVNLPGLGVVKSGWIVVSAVGFLLLVLLMAIGSRASSRRRAAERRRKFRTMTEFHSEPEPEPVHHHAPAPEPAPVPAHYHHSDEPAVETHAAHEHVSHEHKEDEHA
jgi:hypothetical protein